MVGIMAKNAQMFGVFTFDPDIYFLVWKINDKVEKLFLCDAIQKKVIFTMM